MIVYYYHVIDKTLDILAMRGKRHETNFYYNQVICGSLIKSSS